MSLPPVRLLQANFYAVGLPNGEIYVSYKTPVAVKIPGKGGFRSKRSFSRTTSRHLNKWCPKGQFTEVDEVGFTALISEVLGEEIRVLCESPDEKFRRFLDVRKAQ